ncbi:glycosyltransferase family 2 protein [Microbulbifer sp. CAU 1566]|uniref:glycosyltransferase family 2 protein n=1 Tax=Microbulbifer sp. CAU 1566 TaxID=2933269 RepID=UPI002006CAA4|nr:glycosyltransferase family 2 protein [Microbulbifer sp. CAU 1566]MCK7596384.1 glycosyltransferase family 2 protein [Microbulbifer sp. CAU 1566]
MLSGPDFPPGNARFAAWQHTESHSPINHANQPQKPMKLSVIMTTYNSPEWLEKVLWGYSCQTEQALEVIVADDGSRSDTAELVARLREETGLDIRHVWQKDDGFRKCRILNKAILEARGDYIVFTDGDCIPRADFLEVHKRRAERGYFLSGSYFKLPMSTSEAITRDDILSGRCFDFQWLREHGLKARRKTLKLRATPRWAPLLNRITPTACNLKGSNASAWRDDILKVNGFDERMAWGGLDREFGVRLENAGIKPRHVRFDAVCVHLDHPRGYADPEIVARNKALRLRVAKERIIETPQGIRQLLDAGYQPGTKNGGLTD